MTSKNQIIKPDINLTTHKKEKLLQQAKAFKLVAAKPPNGFPKTLTDPSYASKDQRYNLRLARLEKIIPKVLMNRSKQDFIFLQKKLRTVHF